MRVHSSREVPERLGRALVVDVDELERDVRTLQGFEPPIGALPVQGSVPFVFRAVPLIVVVAEDCELCRMLCARDALNLLNILAYAQKLFRAAVREIIIVQ